MQLPKWLSIVIGLAFFVVSGIVSGDAVTAGSAAAKWLHVASTILGGISIAFGVPAFGKPAPQPALELPPVQK